MVGNHQKVEGAGKAHGHPRARHHLLPADQSVSLLRPQPIAGQEGIAGIDCVQVGVAEVDVAGEAATGTTRRISKPGRDSRRGGRALGGVRLESA